MTPTTWADGAVVVATSFIAAGAISQRVARDRLGHPWPLLAVGALLLSATATVWYQYPQARVAEQVAAVLFVASYACYAAFLVSVLRRRSPGATRERPLAAVDAGIFALGATAVLWEGVLEKPLRAAEASPFQAASAIAYVAMLLAVAALVARLVLGALRNGVVLLFFVWMALNIAAAGWVGLAPAVGISPYGLTTTVLSVASHAALVGLALHPSLAGLERALGTAPTSRLRLGLLLAACLVPITTMGLDRTVTIEDVGYLSLIAAHLSLVMFRLTLVTGDLSEQRRLADELVAASAELRHVGLHDSLTGAANRTRLLEHLGHSLSRCRHDARTVALALLDVDDFKVVNDTLGHQAGDALLCHVAECLRANVRPADTVARLGGDEFAVVFEEVEPHEAVALAERILDTLDAPVEVNGRQTRARASLGLYLAEPGADATVALRNADIAMYAAKGRGGGGYALFEAALHDAFVARHELEVELREASCRDELRLVYQPVIRLSDGRVDGVEALLRWDHPTRGLISPADFMAVAEESGAILDVGRWVLREAARQAAAWRRAGVVDDDFLVAVNLSRRQLLDPGIVADVKDAIADSGAPPEVFMVEVTETALANDTDLLAGRLRELAGLGLTIAMDDFGTGYSSLDQLRRLPIDVLKIDRAFVQGIDRGPEDFALATAIARLAASLGKEVLAEGVETPAQFAHLRALRAQKAQGYLFARPMSPPDLVEYLLGRGRLACRPPAG